ncbi:hypothetical protein F4818DRAFT_60145 [Hypoxylon cercidicola]|nr:hypothetical protein F4818DRAFT_60145 [Hypoxylon cercidicola]
MIREAYSSAATQVVLGSGGSLGCAGTPAEDYLLGAGPYLTQYASQATIPILNGYGQDYRGRYVSNLLHSTYSTSVGMWSKRRTQNLSQETPRLQRTGGGQSLPGLVGGLTSPKAGIKYIECCSRLDSVWAGFYVTIVILSEGLCLRYPCGTLWKTDRFGSKAVSCLALRS